MRTVFPTDSAGMITKKLAVVLIVCLASLMSSQSHAASIVDSKHNLALSGPGDIKAEVETEICIFCHTPHQSIGQAALWNHEMSVASYTPYTSTTLKATVGQPTGASKLCLSCHDGTVALGSLGSRSSPVHMNVGTFSPLPTGRRSRLGTDLSDDHPISFNYSPTLASLNGQLKDPLNLDSRVRLDHNGQMQCTSCHDPHNDEFGKFLVMENTGAALCASCHVINSWNASSHLTSTKQWNGTGINPWPYTSKTTVADNACQNCHTPHAAGTPQRLLTFPDEEQNCYSCHSGTVASKNIAAEFGKFSAHPILATSGVHDPLEDTINPPRHVECADCHNPHAANSASASAPNASGALAGLRGVDSFGAVVKPLTHEYELCYRCHADSVVRGTSHVPRQITETNTRIEFDPSNQSYHPIIAPGKNPNVPSLISPLTATSLIYCTDCHNNDQGPGAGGNGPKGPHGSSYVPLLERQQLLTDLSPESEANYALCYKCHSRDSVLSDQSFHAVNGTGQDRGHRFHIADARAACTTCHDPHGVVTAPRLINFNTAYVTPNSQNVLQFTSTGTFRGNCSLTCHDKNGGSIDHIAQPYSPDMIGASPSLLKRKR